MIDALVIAPLLLAAILLISVRGKFSDSDEAARRNWQDIGVPDTLNIRFLRRLHPWGELTLAVALLALPDVPGILAAAAAMLLCVVYLVLIVRARARPEPAFCACFGTRTRMLITQRTVTRNVIILILGLLSLAHAIAVGSPLLTVLRLGPASLMWLVASVLVAVTVHLIEPGADAETPAGTPPTGPETPASNPPAGSEIPKSAPSVSPAIVKQDD